MLPRRCYGRYALLGTGVYLLSQMFGSAFRKILRLPSMSQWRHRYGVSHRVLDEPLELWAALFFLTTMVVLWQASRAYAPFKRSRPRHALAGQT